MDVMYCWWKGREKRQGTEILRGQKRQLAWLNCRILIHAILLSHIFPFFSSIFSLPLLFSSSSCAPLLFLDLHPLWPCERQKKYQSRACLIDGALTGRTIRWSRLKQDANVEGEIRTKTQFLRGN
jgi:hypothetical protein